MPVTAAGVPAHFPDGDVVLGPLWAVRDRYAGRSPSASSAQGRRRSREDCRSLPLADGHR